MEPKYVSLDEVVKAYYYNESRKTAKERMSKYIDFLSQHPYNADHQPGIIITEDIPYEIVENKQLPAPEPPQLPPSKDI